MAELDEKTVTRAQLEKEIVRHYNSVLSYCLFLTKNKADAEDLCQTAVCKALTANFDNRLVNVKAWLMTIARNNYINIYRSRQKFHFVEIIQTDNTAHNIEQVGVELIMKEVSKLDTRKQTVLSMLRDGFQYKEIAESTCINMGTLKSKIYHIRKELNYLKGN